MTAEEYLAQVKYKQTEIENLQRDRENLHQMMYNFGVQRYDEKVQTSRENDRFGTWYSEIDSLDRQVSERILELLTFKTKVSSEINALNDIRFMTLLNCRYLHFQTWETIAEKAFMRPYNVRHVQKLHRLALLSFEEQYKIMLANYDIGLERRKNEIY